MQRATLPLTKLLAKSDVVALLFVTITFINAFHVRFYNLNLKLHSRHIFLAMRQKRRISYTN